jgi:FkbM family methyltransferase
MDDIWAAGRSTSKRAWLTNPSRNGFFIMARPYLAEICRKIDKTIGDFAAAIARIETAERLHGDDAAASLRLSSALKDEMRYLTGQVDGLYKDQLAWGHRLSSLEEGIARLGEEVHDRQQADEGRLIEVEERLADTVDRHIAALERKVETLTSRIDELHAPAGMATLLRGQPIAISGSSLVLSSGPYGCFMLRQPDLISDHILAGAFWDSHLKTVIERAGRPDGSAIDAGAYLGFHTAYMSRFFRAVWAFEPQTEIYRMLCTNLLLNGCRNVTAMNNALYDAPGRLRLAENVNQEIPLPVADGGVDYDRIGNAAALTFQMADANDPMAVCTKTIDQLELEDLAFIKVDTQGSDLHVLKGGRATIQRCRPVIAAEYERELARNHGNTLEEFYSFFDDNDYDVQVLDNRSNGKQIDLLATPR